MKKFRKIKISFTTTEILAVPAEAVQPPAADEPFHCPLCRAPLTDAISSEILVLAEGVDDARNNAEHDCR